MDSWIDEVVTVTEHTHRKNINRAFMRLEVWQKAIELYKLVHGTLKKMPLEFKIRAQIENSALSISSNIAEGYGRRSINEYLQFLYVSKASAAETLSRIVGLKATEQISKEQFDLLDSLHYEVENKLLALIKA